MASVSFEVIDKDHPAFGRRAIMRRQKVANDSAWYEIVGDLTPEMIASGEFPFAAGSEPDRHGRTNHCVLWPEQVGEWKKKK